MIYRHSLVAAIAAMAIVSATAAEAQAPVSSCSALTLYANAARTGLCKKVSPTTQHLWVCELTEGAPDVHLTFNATVPLHITVRTRGCQGNSRLSGVFPRVFRVMPGQPTTLCRVSLQSYLDRLKAVPRLQPRPYVPTAIDAARRAGRVTAETAHTYREKARQLRCQ